MTFSVFMALRLFKVKDEAVIVKMNSICFVVDTIVHPFHDASI